MFIPCVNAVPLSWAVVGGLYVVMFSGRTFGCCGPRAEGIVGAASNQTELVGLDLAIRSELCYKKQIYIRWVVGERFKRRG